MIKVSICCITFNHEPYLRQCLDGFLMQQCDFEYEILIHDDASTDGTIEIIREYEKKSPNIIKPVIQSENQYSKGVRGINLLYNFPRAKGKYIAICEGDDYWTDSSKLQKQVDFLETHPEYSLVVGGYNSKHEYTKVDKIVIRENRQSRNSENGYSFLLEDTYKQWNTKVLTAVFVNDSEIFASLSEYKYSRDVHLFYHLLKKGKGFYFTEVFGVHRIHSGGVHSMVDKRKLTVGAYYIYNELYLKNKDEYTRKLCLNYHLMVLNIKIFNGKFAKEYNLKMIELLKNTFRLLQSPSDALLLYQIFIGGNLKQRIKGFLKQA